MQHSRQGLLNLQEHAALRSGSQIRRRTESARPDDFISAGDDGPTAALPQRDTRLLEEKFDPFPSCMANRPVVVSGPPVTQLQGPGNPVPVQTTHRSIISGFGGFGRWLIFNKFEQYSRAPLGQWHAAWNRGGKAEIAIFKTVD